MQHYCLIRQLILYTSINVYNLKKQSGELQIMETLLFQSLSCNCSNIRLPMLVGFLLHTLNPSYGRLCRANSSCRRLEHAISTYL